MPPSDRYNWPKFPQPYAQVMVFVLPVADVLQRVGWHSATITVVSANLLQSANNARFEGDSDERSGNDDNELGPGAA